MIDHLAGSTDPARAETGIYALLIAASLYQGTVRTDGAFRSACWRYAKESRHAGAYRLPVVRAAKAVGSAGRG